MLVEETCVEVQDLLAHEVEAEVPRLDHPGVDRANRHLVCVTALHRHGPACYLEIVVDERAHRLVPLEAHAVEIVRLALVPVRRRDEVDDRRYGAGGALDSLDSKLSLVVREHDAHGSSGGHRIQAGERPPAFERLGQSFAVSQSRRPQHGLDELGARQPWSQDGEREQGSRCDDRERDDRAQTGR